ncbi:MAG: 2-amino-4-hydroxy-6-hydroxymethyldihydropteridine diphosphokinase [Bacteroidota bacterium]|jgi:2-amino-4-hydroxy-6-hydroxymethyldihydropteridine diphosphokinase
MNKVYLLIGGNMGDRMANLDLSKQAIEKALGPIQTTSSVYETAAWGPIPQPDFLNQALLVHTHLEANQVMDTLLQIEKQMGRNRLVPLGPRVIDLDIIYFNEAIIHSNNLELPHPRMAERKFVLLPLSEIAPNYIHPIFNKTNADLLKECGDSLAVYKKTDL